MAKLLSDLYKSSWNSATSYTVGDIVVVDGSSYVCIANNTNQTPPNVTYWGLLSAKGDDQLTSEQATDLTDSGDSTLHYHASDRSRSNHTGSQTASTISDFDTEVSNNTDVAANTSARHTHANKTTLDAVEQALTNALKTNYDSAYTHVSNTSNPHSVTAAQVGLGNVDNTSDLSKPISTATQTALDGKSATSHNHNLNDLTEKSYNSLTDKPSLGTAAALNSGTSSGNVPVLDGSGKLDIGLLPGVALTDTFVVASEAAMLALSAQTGDVAVRSDENKTYILKGTSASTLADWQELLTPTDSVHSVFGRQGTVTAQTNDYTWAQINKATSSLADIATRSYNDLQNLPTLGTLASQNGTFSGGGTLATGGFTLTVPATGTSALLGTANTFTALQSIVVDQGNAELQAFTYRDTPSAGFFRANKARGTLASPTVVQDGDLIGGFIGNAYTGSIFFASAQVSLFADGPMGSQRLPGRIDLMTSDGTSSPAVRMVIKNDGDVGIGTTSPAYKLDVNGTFRANTTTPVFGANTLTIPATGTVALLGTANVFTATQTIEHTTTGVAYQLVLNNASTSASARGGFQMTRAGDSGTSTTRGSALFTTNTLFGFADYEARSMAIYTGATVGTNSARLVVSPDGKVGIGTTSPVGNFDAVLDGNGGIFRRFGGSPSMVFERANGTISSPTQVNSATTIGAFSAQAYDNTGVYRSVGLIRFNSTAAVTSTSSPGSISFQTTPSGSTTASDRMIIDSTGNVGIGTTTPATSALLDLTSTTKALIVTRMTTAQRDALTAVDGMILYNTTTGGFQGRAGGAWVNL